MADETESTWENTVKNEVAEMAHQTRRSPENREIGSGADGWGPANKCGCRGVVEGLSSSMRWKKFLRWQCADGISMYSRFVHARFERALQAISGLGPVHPAGRPLIKCGCRGNFSFSQVFSH